MDRNEAIAHIAEAAIAGITIISENAIKLLDGGSFAEAIAATATEASTMQTVASTGEKRPRGRPRKAEGPAPEITPTPEPEPEPTTEVVAHNEETAIEADEMDVYHADKFDVEERAFPVYPDSWFAENLEEARNHCRALLSARMAEIGPDETRKEVLTTTQKGRVSDFDAEACAKFYRAITRAIVNV
jgi:hypothetical protein